MHKRILHAILALVFVCGSVQAQVGSPRNMLSLGGSFGMLHSGMDFTPAIKQDLNLGYTGGVMLRYTCEKYFFILCSAQLEANLVQRGWSEWIDDGSGNTYSRVMNYIEVPVLAHLGFGREARGVQGFVNLGPQFGLFLNESETYGGGIWDVSKRPNNVTGQYGKAVENKFEYGIAGGLGMEIRTGIGGFSLEGRYYFGLSDIFGNSKKDYFGRSANNGIYAKVAYIFSL